MMHELWLYVGENASTLHHPNSQYLDYSVWAGVPYAGADIQTGVDNLFKLGDRFVKAKIATGYKVDICPDSPRFCFALEEFQNAQVALGWSLRRAEGRPLTDPPFRCCKNPALWTFGGCCTSTAEGLG